MKTDPTEETSCERLAVLVMAGLPSEMINSANLTLNILIQLKNNGYAEETITGTGKRLIWIAKHADINNPEEVKTLIANMKGSATYKASLVTAYQKYVTYNKLELQKPKYKNESHNVKIPTHETLQMLIAHAGKKMRLKLMISLECGLRPIELCNLKVKDLDLDHRLINPTTAKHGAARSLKISLTLQELLREYISIKQLNPNNKLFPITPRSYSKLYAYTRNKLADDLHNPTIKTIRLYDFRHYFATTLYQKTRDILYVKQQLGHRDINNTMIYTQFIDLNVEEYTCRTAKTVDEATPLLESGFNYIQEIDGIKIYRKRK